jgi:hypothetical protein
VKNVETLMLGFQISTPTDVNEVAAFLRENPHLDKKQLGEDK